jgi:hypothetical protein
MQRPTRVVVVVILATIVTARVSPAQTKASTSPTSAACSLLSKQDSAAALGEAVTGPQSSSVAASITGAPASSCEYSGSGIHMVHLNLMTLSGANAAMYKMLCAQKTKEGLAGLGDTACWYNSKHEELQVLKGTTFFSIELRKSGDPTEAIKGVAKKVFDQLK